MTNNAYKIVESENNINIDCDKMINALVLQKLNPIISIPFVCKKKIDEKLCERAGIEYKNGSFYKNDVLITDDILLKTITDSLIESVNTFANRKEDTTFQCVLVKNILEEKVIKHLNKDQNTPLSIEDLMKSLYGVEEQGSKKL